MQGAAREAGDRLCLHRCLQHTKSDIRAAAFKKDEETGKVRLRQAEMCPVIIEWVEFSAWLPNDLEFDCFWWHILLRMSSSGAPTDFDEPAMARYLATFILCCQGNIIRAAWASGFGAVPLGFTTYAPNCIERCHRTVRGLLPGVYKSRDVATLMAQVCDIVDGKLADGHYRGLVSEMAEPPPGIFHWRKAKRAKIGEWHVADEDFVEAGAQKLTAPQRLDLQP